MITFQEARQIAETAINRQQTLDNDILIIIDEQIIEKDYAWIFPFTSKKYWETKDVNYAIGGNGPLFISKFDGQISNYQTGQSIDQMIDAYEEENKIWSLALTDNTLTDKNKALALKQVLGLAISEILHYKKNDNLIFESGSRTRLVEIQKELSFKNIQTNLIQRILVS